MRVKIAICGGPIQALSSDMDTLYVGIKEGFNRQWDPDVLVERAKERTLSISLKKLKLIFVRVSVWYSPIPEGLLEEWVNSL